MDKLILLLGFVIICNILTACALCVGIKSEQLNPADLHKTVYVDASFEEWQENYILNALKDWECVGNGMIKFNIKLRATQFDYDAIKSPKNVLIIAPASVLHPEIVYWDAEKKKKPIISYTIGLYTKTSKNIPLILMVNERLGIPNYKAVALHEIGHSLGLDHDSSKESIMYEVIDDGSKKLMHYDIVSLCNKYGCDPAKLSACKN